MYWNAVTLIKSCFRKILKCLLGRDMCLILVIKCYRHVDKEKTIPTTALVAVPEQFLH